MQLSFNLFFSSLPFHLLPHDISCVNIPMYLLNVVATYENKIYSVGGTVTAKGRRVAGMLYIRQGTSESLANLFYLDSYLRIVDFSKPVDSSEHSIDISTNKITTAIRLPDNIPLLQDGILFISDGVMHMLPGINVDAVNTDADANILNTTTHQVNLIHNFWSFDLKIQTWDIHFSEVEDLQEYDAFAFDTEKQVGWYYGGVYTPDDYKPQHLYRLDREEMTPVEVETESSAGTVFAGELVYIEGAGKAGILVLIGGEGQNNGPQVSMTDKSMNCAILASFLTNMYTPTEVNANSVCIRHSNKNLV